MKKNNILNYIAFLIISVIYLSSCDKEAVGTMVEPTTPEVGFLVSKSSLELDETGKFIVDIYRGNVSGELKVELQLIDENSLFTLESKEVFFEANSNKTTATITYNISDLEYAEIYDAILKPANEEIVTQFGNKEINLSLTRKLTWKQLGTGYYYSSLFGEGWDQDILYAEENPNVLRLKDCISLGYDITFVTDESGQIISFPTQTTGYSYGTYGHVYYLYDSSTFEGNTYEISIHPCVSLNGQYASITGGQAITEYLELPEQP